MHHLFAHELQDRGHPFRQLALAVVGRASEHEGQGSGAGAYHAARHGSVDEAVGGGGVHCVCDFGGGGGVDGGAVDEQTVGRRRRRGKGRKIRETRMEDMPEDGFDVSGLREDSDDDFLESRPGLACERVEGCRILDWILGA